MILWGTRTLAKKLGVDESTVRRHAAAGLIPGATRTMGERGHWRFDASVVSAWLESRASRACGGDKRLTGR